MGLISRLIHGKTRFDYMNEEHYKGPGVLVGGKKSGSFMDEQRAKLAEEDKLAQALSGENKQEAKISAPAKSTKVKKPGFLSKLFIDKETLKIWDQLPASAKRTESAKGAVPDGSRAGVPVPANARFTDAADGTESRGSDGGPHGTAATVRETGPRG